MTLSTQELASKLNEITRDIWVAENGSVSSTVSNQRASKLIHDMNAFRIPHMLKADPNNTSESIITLGLSEAQEFADACRNDRPTASIAQDPILTQLVIAYPSLVWLKQVDNYLATGMGRHATSALAQEWQARGAKPEETYYETGGDAPQAAVSLSADDAQKIVEYINHQQTLLDPSITKLQGMFGGGWQRSDADVFTGTMSIESAQAAEEALQQRGIPAQFNYYTLQAPYHATMTLERDAAKTLLGLSIAEQTFIAADCRTAVINGIAY